MDRKTVLEARSLRKQVTSPGGNADHPRRTSSLAIAARRDRRDRRRLRRRQIHAARAARRARRAERRRASGSKASSCPRWTRTAARPRARSHVGFVFQSFHLVPSLTAHRERDAAARARRQARCARSGARRAAAGRPRDRASATTRASSRAASSSASPSPAPSSRGPRCCSPTSRPATSTRRPGDRVIELLFDLNAANGTTLVLVTHDRAIAARCNRVIELDAGRLVS